MSKFRQKFACLYRGKHFGYCFADSEADAVADCVRRNPHHIASEFSAYFVKMEEERP